MKAPWNQLDSQRINRAVAYGNPISSVVDSLTKCRASQAGIPKIENSWFAAAACFRAMAQVCDFGIRQSRHWD